MYVQKFFELFGHGAYDEYNRRLRDFLARTVCGELGQVLCEDDLFVIGGVDKISLNTVSHATQPVSKLQALPVYDVLPSTAAVFSYAIESRKLSANEQFFCWCSNSSKFVTNNSDKTRRVIHRPPTKFTPAQIKPQSFESRRNSSSFFTRGGCVSCLRACLALGCFYSHISTRTFRRALTASLDSCAEIKSAPTL